MTRRADEGLPWWEDAFREDYLQVYPHRDVPSARREVAGLLAPPPGAPALRDPVLDVGAGFGRHVLALRESGRRAFGLDQSADLLAHARALPGGDLLAGRLVRADARRLPLRPASLGSVVVLFSSFGYLDEAGDAALLAALAGALAPRGVLVLDLMNPGRVRAGLVAESTTERAGLRLVERRRLAEGGRRVVKDVRLARADGAARAWREDVRLYEPEEIDALLRRAGLEPAHRAGGLEGAPYGPDAERQVVWAVRGS